jgi:hypothetical protein
MPWRGSVHNFREHFLPPNISYHITSSASAPVSRTPRRPPQPAPEHQFPVSDTSLRLLTLVHQQDWMTACASLSVALT